MQKKLLIAALSAVAISMPKSGAMPDYDHEAVADSLNTALASKHTTADSLTILTDLYDVVTAPAARDSLATMIFEMSLRTSNSRTGLDILRNSANMNMKNDSILRRDLDRAYLFPESQERAETVTFIEMLRNLYRVRYAKPDEIDREIHSLLRKINAHKNEETSLYQNIVELHALCLFIGECAQGQLLSKYTDALDKLIDQLRPEAYAIRHAFYLQAAMSYSANDEHEKAVAMDKKLLACIDNLESGAAGLGRNYRDYDGHRYIVYTRLLSNSPYLTPEEAETYYAEAMKLVENDARSRNTNEISGLPQIYYAIYKKDYPKALDLLKTYVDMPYNRFNKKRLLRMMLTCAQAVGDKEAMLKASLEYNTILEQTLDSRTREKYKELQIVYDVNELKEAHAREAWRHNRTMLWLAIGVSVLLLLGLVIIALLWRHARKLANNLKNSNDSLRQESENLKKMRNDLINARDEAANASRIKSDFIRNMSSEIAVPVHTINEYANLLVDCSEAGVKPYLKNFSDLVLLNSELLTTIVTDMLHLSEIDSRTLVIKNKKDQIQHLLNAAVASVKHRVNDNVTITVDPTLPDYTIDTDPRRFLQVMVQLLSNAAKFTAKGSITVDYQVDPKAKMIRIRVTDTGPGIAAANQERIFKRFVKLDSNSQGVGIGLPLARHIAELLGGTLILDTTYNEGGARFIFSIPFAPVGDIHS